MQGRSFSEVCRELAEAAQKKGQDTLATLLRMAALEAAESGVRQDDGWAKDLLVGTWDWDVENNLVYADARFAALFGISASDAASGTPLTAWLHAVHPDDRDRLQAAIRASLKGALFSIEYRVTSEGKTHWVYARGKCTIKAGRAVRFPGAIVDITHEKADEVSIAPQ